MNNKMNVLYISISGNTNHFVRKMSKLFHNVHLHRIDDQTDLFAIKEPYFVFIPTYAKGTQEDPDLHEKQPGENFGIQELSQTLTMNDELGYKKNYKNCLGSIPSGNKNFGKDLYCWTGMHYFHKYGIPILDDYELRGTLNDEQRINNKMVAKWNKNVPDYRVKNHRINVSSPLLKRVQRKYKKNQL